MFLFQFKYGKITSKHNGAVKKGIIFATYSSLIGESHSQAKYHTRLKQILHWCGEDFDGPVSYGGLQSKSTPDADCKILSDILLYTQFLISDKSS